ncbi:Leucine Rich Repeat family protein [Trichomonas vaginalis G3]|uniref:Leucine Rich Repeat family protein n=1 Tax=Trichomonas vaginalis (strain ATCC PRA-98 / G3) TaxID=412133 RepID=A2F2G2_TRIV3|nr:uncharacterized protein TVAGG3_0253260 [Trichomonas vaginalis G3]EAY00928.1 Leucine Rich Repeat family protein [Trichomonas vaginalis G3]KAI5554177.1 ribonuclease inhibitor domain-containing protein [Trichomonas vaginalis G3]|eukprot:XP_001313857.1 hypothetical protein [Trichomonas vaginalis G3]
MTELQVFQCSNNAIKKIQPCFPRNIQSIDLSDNPIKSLSFIENSGLTKLEYLNISNTAIKYISDVKFLRFLPKLQELNIPIPTTGEKINFTEIVRTACSSLKYLNEEDITFFNNDTKAKKIVQLFEKGTEDDFIEFIHQPDLTFTWKNPVFIPFDDSLPPLDRETIKERLTVLEATMIAPNFATDLKFKLNSLEKQLNLLIAPPAPKNEMGEIISLITPFKEGDEALLDSLLDEVRQIKRQLSQVTQVLYGQDTAIKRLWNDIYGE